MQSLSVWQERGGFRPFLFFISFGFIIYTEKVWGWKNSDEDGCVSGKEYVRNKGVYEKDLGGEGSETCTSISKNTKLY